MGSTWMRRLVPLCACVALLLGLQGAVPAVAGPQVFSNGDITLTVSGGPVALIGEGGSCSDPGTGNLLAHLSADLTFTYTPPLPTAPDGSATDTLVTWVGVQQHFFEYDRPPGLVVHVPAAGGGNIGHHFTCSDANPNGRTLRITVVAYSNQGIALSTLFADYPLSAID